MTEVTTLSRLDLQRECSATLTAIDLFAGAGGLSEGFRNAGFQVRAASDWDTACAATFRDSHPGTVFLECPVQELEGERLAEAAGVARGELTVLLGGPPCQAFSVYNHQRGFHDERSGLFREYLRLVEALMPSFVVMENVTGMTSVAEGRAVDEIYSCLERLGYYVEHKVLKAEEYGVPQERRRIFFIGSRDHRTLRWPPPTHSATKTLFTDSLQSCVTVEEAIGDLPVLALGEGTEEMNYTTPPSNEFQERMRAGSMHLWNHVAPCLGDINRERLKHIPQGGSWRDIPHHLLPAGMKAARRSDHTKRYGRLHPQGLSCTILTKCDLHWGAYIHPTQERTLTVREAARFQSFPDRIRFRGSRVEQFRQVGNAVPPLVAWHIAQELKVMAGVASHSTGVSNRG